MDILALIKLGLGSSGEVTHYEVFCFDDLYMILTSAIEQLLSRNSKLHSQFCFCTLSVKNLPVRNTSTKSNDVFKTEMSAVLTDLLILERKINDVRCANRFPPHTSVASCMYDRRLLDDDAWVSTYSTPLVCSLIHPSNYKNWKCVFIKAPL